MIKRTQKSKKKEKQASTDKLRSILDSVDRPRMGYTEVRWCGGHLLNAYVSGTKQNFCCISQTGSSSLFDYLFERGQAHRTRLQNFEYHIQTSRLVSSS